MMFNTECLCARKLNFCFYRLTMTCIYLVYTVNGGLIDVQTIEIIYTDTDQFPNYTYHLSFRNLFLSEMSVVVVLFYTLYMSKYN